jgi:predicted ferric reductase
VANRWSHHADRRLLVGLALFCDPVKVRALSWQIGDVADRQAKWHQRVDLKDVEPVSRYDYEVSRTIGMCDFPFGALLMALMSQADSRNTEKLKAAFPEVWAELTAWRNAPGGYLIGESAAGSTAFTTGTHQCGLAPHDRMSDNGPVMLSGSDLYVCSSIRFRGLRRVLERTLWATTCLAVLLMPVLVGLRRAGDSSPLSELSVGMGIFGTSVLVCAVVLPSRLRSLTRTFGIDGVLGMHRFAGLLVTALVLAHIVLVVAVNPANLGLLDIVHAPNRARAATGATGALGALIALTVLRRRLRHRYEVWRWVHVALASSVLVLTALHIWWLNHLIRDRAMRAWFAILVLVVVGVLAYRWLWRPVFGTRGKYVVREIRPETATVSTLVLQPRGDPHRPGRRTMRFAPGQFAWLRVSPSIGAQDHPFTIASSAHLRNRREFTVRHSGDFTRALRRLRPGDPVWLDGPHGSFSVDLQHSAGLVMIAGGVGITPMISMLRTLAHRRDRRPHRLVMVARTVDELLFRAELRELQKRLDLTIIELLRQPPEGWTGASGAVDEALLTALLPGRLRRNQLGYYLCGPPALVTDVLTVLDELNVPLPRIHTEKFGI